MVAEIDNNKKKINKIHKKISEKKSETKLVYSHEL